MWKNILLSHYLAKTECWIEEIKNREMMGMYLIISIYEDLILLILKPHDCRAADNPSAKNVCMKET